jgi:heme exporter protein A
VLETSALECERGGRTLFRGLDLVLRPGQLLRVTGANGSGKTSLLRILCGLLTPSAGEVRWRGAPIRSLGEEYGKQLVYLGHAPAVKGDLSAAENLSIASALAGFPVSRAQVQAALAALALAAVDVPVRKLSQGQRRRAALARLCLSAAATLWLLDEPFTALDAQGVERLRELFARHLAGGGAIVFTTHQDPGIAATQVLDLG